MKLDLTTFILSVSTAAYMGLGLGPRSGQEGDAHEVNLDLARQNIDLLELLWEKTQGNRSPDEEKLLEQLLFETRDPRKDAKPKKGAAKKEVS